MIDCTDIIGCTFGRLTVLEYSGHFTKEGTKEKRHYYKCQCSCERQTVILVDRYKLLSGHSTSCGCKAVESVKKRNKEDNPSKYINRKLNEHYVDESGIGHIKLSNSDNEILCDLEDIDKLLRYYWHENKGGYAISAIGHKKIYAHRIVLNAGDYDKNNLVDHINGNTLDNRKKNLRIVNNRQNNTNVSVRKDSKTGINGVVWDKRRNRWIVRVFKNGRPITMGYFKDFDEAVQARKEAELKYYGEYSYTSSRNASL